MGRAKLLVAGIIVCACGLVGAGLLVDVLLLDARLAREGIPRTAKVVRLSDLGSSSENHEYWAELDIDLGDGQTSHLDYAMVHEELARQGGAGSTWKILMLPDRPTDLFPPRDATSGVYSNPIFWVQALCAAGLLAIGVFLIVRWRRPAPSVPGGR